MAIQFYNGQILFDENQIAMDVDCCCGGPTTACTVCDSGTSPSSITVDWGAGTNLTGMGLPCTGDCNDWFGPWDCPQLTQAEINALQATWPAAFTPMTPLEGCYYGLTTGLPCDAEAMIVELTNGGASGFAQAGITVGFNGGDWARIGFSINTAGTDDDCLTNFNTGGGGVDSASNAVGGSPACDFLNVIFDFSLLNITANA